jgi:hypothetical protein
VSRQSYAVSKLSGPCGWGLTKSKRIESRSGTIGIARAASVLHASHLHQDAQSQVFLQQEQVHFLADPFAFVSTFRLPCLSISLTSKGPSSFRVLMSRVSCLFSALLYPHSERSYSGRRSCECGRMTPRGAREFAASEMLKSLDVSLRNKPTPLSFSRSHVGIRNLPGLGV